MKDTTSLRHIILDKIQVSDSIAIMSHVEPDGDGFCASLALQQFLKSHHRESEIIVDDANLERFEFLMEGANLSVFQTGMRYDLLFILDCNSYSRIGKREELVGTADYTILIDHHVPENGVIATDFSFVDTSASSVGAILFRALAEDIMVLPENIRIPIANCLYVTILNDTNNFTNANTDSEVFQISRELSDCGISASTLYKSFFLNHEALEMRYIGEVLSTIELYDKERILYMESTLEMQHRNNLNADSIMSITRWVQGVKGVAVIVYLREEATNLYKLSLRSPSLDVNALAAQYGGGGHRSASGAVVSGELQSIKSELLQKLSQALSD